MTYVSNLKRRPFIVGDVHGCFVEFLNLLEAASYDPEKHRLILVGDLINRGPYSFEMLKWVRDCRAEVVLGNHEDVFLRTAGKNRPVNFAFDRLKRQMGGELENWLEWIKSWPLYIEEDDFIAVHAGLCPGKTLDQTDPDALLYIRTWDQERQALGDGSHPPWYEFYKGSKLVVYGHWASQGLNVRSNTVGLDSGCVYGQKLSGIFLPERKIVQVRAEKNYTGPV